MRVFTRFGAAAVAVAVIAIAGAVGAGGRPTGARAAATTTVEMQRFRFTTPTVSIKVGDTIRWLNQDPVAHTATTEAYPGFNSGPIKQGETWSQTFNTAGVFTYFCIVHPNMRGVINVGEAATSAPSTYTAPVAPAGSSTLALTGAEEVPAVTTPDHGSFAFKASTTQLDYTFSAYGYGLTMAHIHQGAKGTNGPVVAFLFGPKSEGVNEAVSSGSITAANLVGPMQGKPISEFMRALNAGELYVNAHTIDKPGGEIRIQIPAAAAPGAPAAGSGRISGSPAMNPGLAMAAVLAGATGVAGAAAWRRRRSR